MQKESNNSSNNANKSNNKKIAAALKLPVNINTPETTPAELTATVINTSSNQNLPRNFSIVIGTASGLVLIHI